MVINSMQRPFNILGGFQDMRISVLRQSKTIMT